jgi:hypothetical protein
MYETLKPANRGHAKDVDGTLHDLIVMGLNVSDDVKDAPEVFER